jgi:hypothetical protein
MNVDELLRRQHCDDEDASIAAFGTSSNVITGRLPKAHCTTSKCNGGRIAQPLVENLRFRLATV